MSRERRKVLSAIVVTLTVTLLLTMSMSVAYATKPTEVTWTGRVIGFTVEDVIVAGESDNIIVTLHLTVLQTGDIAGTSTTDTHLVYHNWMVGVPPTLQPGPVNVHGTTTNPAAVVTIDGVTYTGSLTILLNAVEYPSLRSAEGTWRIIGGTGDLANLHGQGTYFDPPGPSPPAPNVGTHTGQVHFDP